MSPTPIFWTIGFTIFLTLVGIGIPFAMSNGDSGAFWISRICSAAAALDMTCFTIYWLVSTKQKLLVAICVGSAACAVMGGLLIVALLFINARDALTSPVLIPSNELSPPVPRGASIPDNALVLFLGSAVAWETRFPHSIVQMNGEDMLTIDRDSRGYLIIKLLRIFDDRNNIIARIDGKNGFWVDPSSRRERPNPSTLIVYDHNDDQVLNIKFLNPKTLRILGTFRRGRIPPVILSENYVALGGGRLVSLVLGESGAGGGAGSTIAIDTRPKPEPLGPNGEGYIISTGTVESPDGSSYIATETLQINASAQISLMNVKFYSPSLISIKILQAGNIVASTNATDGTAVVEISSPVGEYDIKAVIKNKTEKPHARFNLTRFIFR